MPASSHPAKQSLNPPPVYVPPAEVFQYWMNQHLRCFPGERPALEWLRRNSRLPLSTCSDYRRRYEEQFPDLYALTQIKRNLRLTRRARPAKDHHAKDHHAKTPNSEK